MTDPRSLCMNIIFYRPLSPATETHRPGTSLGFLPSEWSRAGNVKGHIGASSAALLSGVPSGAWSPRRPSRRSPRSCKPRKGRLRYRTLGPAIRIVRKRTTTTRRRSKSDSAASSSWRGAGGGPEREREASRPIGLGRAREESEGEEAPRVSRVSATPRLGEGGFFAYRAAEPRLEHGVLPPRLVLLPVETHDGWCVRPQA